MSLQHLCWTHNPYWVCCSHHRAKSVHHLLIPCVLEEAVLVPYHQKQSSPIATFRRRMSSNTNATSQDASPVIEPSHHNHAALAPDAHGSTPSSKSPEGKAASGSRSSTTHNDSESAKWDKIVAKSRAEWRSLIRRHRKGRRRTLFGIKNAVNGGANTQRGGLLNNTVWLHFSDVIIQATTLLTTSKNTPTMKWSSLRWARWHGSGKSSSMSAGALMSR